MPDQKGDSFEYVRLTKNLLPEAMEVIRTSFWPSENMSVAMGLSKHPELFPYMDPIVLGAAKDGVSIVALDKATGKIAGVLINKFAGEKDHALTYDKQLESSQGLIIKNYLEYLTNLEEKMLEHCKGQTSFEIFLCGVRPEYRKRGIGTKLHEEAVELAKKLKNGEASRIPVDDDPLENIVPEIITDICTTKVTQKMSQDLNFTIGSRVDYDSLIFQGESLSAKVPNGTRSITLNYFKL
ncbi:unnamed protein product [Ceutorhynchus assimilis]|uniref:N-acetyltransferase domain-containing protein n=1 Tax=Ceutorhynchus assimilis TaxID=467358 RepID=A0A9N9QFC5_9CUCU|nr:unnamed protein product [Ceutorhynchus assimilis]